MFCSTGLIQTLPPHLFHPTVSWLVRNGWAGYFRMLPAVWRSGLCPFPSLEQALVLSLVPQGSWRTGRGAWEWDTKTAKAGNATISALGWFDAAVIIAGTTLAPSEEGRKEPFLPFSCPLSRSLCWGWHHKGWPELPLLAWVTFAGQGIFPFLPKDGTRIHQNRAARHPGCFHICEKSHQEPAGRVQLIGVLPWPSGASFPGQSLIGIKIMGNNSTGKIKLSPAQSVQQEGISSPGGDIFS